MKRMPLFSHWLGVTIAATLFAATLTGCEKAELVTARAVTADRGAYMEGVVRLQGERVKDTGLMRYITTGLLREFILEDDSGRIRVFYNSAGWRCPPRTGAKLAVTGKVVENGKRLIFVAKSISIEDQLALAENQVRLCQLDRREAEAYAEQGVEGLRDYWRAAGKTVKDLVHD